MFAHKEKIEKLLIKIYENIDEAGDIFGRKIDRQDGEAKTAISILVRTQVLIDEAINEEKKLRAELVISQEKAKQLLAQMEASKSNT
tara:strand:- start:3876 stop:4136 length:261 start_codon:yes stop_codon:yes gene_type:complete